MTDLDSVKEVKRGSIIASSWRYKVGQITKKQFVDYLKTVMELSDEAINGIISAADDYKGKV